MLLGELLAIVLSLSSTTNTNITYLAFVSLFIQWTACSCAGILCLAKNYLRRLRLAQAASLSYLIILLTALLITEIAWHSSRIFTYPPGMMTSGRGAFMLNCIGITAIVSALALRYFYVQHQRLRHVEAAANARMQMLQARMRPHFFFNCMNTIASLTRQQPALAEEAVEDLSDLFLACLREAGEWSSLADEIVLCKRYLRIESHRFSDRLTTVWEIGEAPGTMPIPTLILQPLVENAVYHGIEPLPQGGEIRIRVERDNDDNVVISIANPVASNVSLRHYRGNQMAQENVRQRLAAHYGERGRLLIEASEQRYLVKLILPYENTDR